MSGLATTDTIIIDMRPSGTYSTDTTMQANWIKVYRAAITAANTVTFYATEKPSAAIPLTIIKVKPA